MFKLINLSCDFYDPCNINNLDEVAKCIDTQIIKYFKDQKVVIRGIQSQKHTLSKKQLIEKIIKTGSDRYETDNKYAVKVNDKPIDFYGYGYTVKGVMTLSILEGFHKWKPRCLEKPQYKIDVWIVYDASKLTNVEYLHKRYNVMVSDGYRFVNYKNKKSALIGVIVLD